MTTLKEQIQEDMKTAMRGHEKERLATIRLILAAVKQREVDERITLAKSVKLVDHTLEQLQTMSSDEDQKRASILRLTDAILVWFASMRPLTRWLVGTYGDLRVRATWMDAGPQGMKFASCLSRIRRSD